MFISLQEHPNMRGEQSDPICHSGCLLCDIGPEHEPVVRSVSVLGQPRPMSQLLPRNPAALLKSLLLGDEC